MTGAMDRREIEATFTDAARAALRRYPFEVTCLELVALSENVTFRVDTATGRSYVLRLHRPGYHSLPELQSERVWLRALAEAGIAVPIPVVSADGGEHVSVTVAVAEEQRFVGLTLWVEGEIIGPALIEERDADVVARRFGQLGNLMAELHNQASRWRPGTVLEPILGASRPERQRP